MEPTAQTQGPKPGNTTQMTNPPTTNTDMTKPPQKKQGERKLKMVKMRAVRAIEYTDEVTKKRVTLKGYDKNSKGVVVPGEIVEISLRQFRQLAKPAEGYFAFGGERHGADGQQKHQIARVELYVPPQKSEDEDFEAPAESDDYED
jgi:hypothetical protein